MLIATALVACGKSGQSMSADAHLSVEAGSTRGEFVCKQSSSGACDFELFVENCSETKNRSRPESANCARHILERFSLKAGDSRLFQSLPLGVKYCVNRRGSSEEPACPPSAPPVAPKKPRPQTA
jgi:hypothetical protein